MTKPNTDHLGKWNEVVTAFHTESDRGAAVLAASFAENQLRLLLLAVAKNGKAAKDLFNATGPLSSFSQCITCAYAFGCITDSQYNDLNLIRQIRNFFSHHPREASFLNKKVSGLVAGLSPKSVHDVCKESTENNRLRAVYIMACAFFCGAVDAVLEGKGIKKPRTKSKT